MRRYRIEHWSADRRALLERVETTADEFDAANDPDGLGDAWDEIRALTIGQMDRLPPVPSAKGAYVILGGGAAPITVITCIEE